MQYFAVNHNRKIEDYKDRKGNILIISPHPDDDVIGAGGAMLHASRQGRGVFSIYITDGGGSPRVDAAISDEEMAQVREKEAKESLKIIGATGGFFLRRKSSELDGAHSEEIKKEIIGILNFLKAEEIYVPSPYERHRTHQCCTKLTIEALRQIKTFRPMLWGYSIWGTFWGGENREVRPINHFMPLKIKAIQAHASQNRYKRYDKGILARNYSDSIFWESHGFGIDNFVEIFLDMRKLIEEKDLTLEEFIRRDVENFIKGYF